MRQILLVMKWYSLDGCKDPLVFCAQFVRLSSTVKIDADYEKAKKMAWKGSDILPSFKFKKAKLKEISHSNGSLEHIQKF